MLAGTDRSGLGTRVFAGWCVLGAGFTCSSFSWTGKTRPTVQSTSKHTAFSSSQTLCGCSRACAAACEMNRKAESYGAVGGGDLSTATAGKLWQSCSLVLPAPRLLPGCRCHRSFLSPTRSLSSLGCRCRHLCSAGRAVGGRLEEQGCCRYGNGNHTSQTVMPLAQTFDVTDKCHFSFMIPVSQPTKHHLPLP